MERLRRLLRSSISGSVMALLKRKEYLASLRFDKSGQYVVPLTTYLFARRTIYCIYSRSTFMNLRPYSNSPRYNYSTLKAKDIDSTPPYHTFNLVLNKMYYRIKYTQYLYISLNDPYAKIDYSKKQLTRDERRLEISRLAPIVSLHYQMIANFNNSKYLNEMILEVTEEEEKQILMKELAELETRKYELMEECLENLLPPYLFEDSHEVTMEFKPGVGGTEASLFVEDISEMYLSYCERMGWRTTIVSSQKEAGSKGYKHLNVKVIGYGAYQLLKCEAGVHKVIRVPYTYAKGRLHSSAISLVIMPTVPFNFSVNPKDIKYTFTRSSGPGGQAVNKTDSACRATHIPTGLAVFIQYYRVQDANKKRATEILKERLFAIEYEKMLYEYRNTRRSQVTGSDRSDKIRTYNYPQDRITDHRTGLTLFGIKEMLKSSFLEEFITAYMNKRRKYRLTALIEELKEEKKY